MVGQDTDAVGIGGDDFRGKRRGGRSVERGDFGDRGRNERGGRKFNEKNSRTFGERSYRERRG